MPDKECTLFEKKEEAEAAPSPLGERCKSNKKI
jgi:hypothetical protein